MENRKISLQSVLDVLKDEPYQLEGSNSIFITNAATIANSNNTSLIWIKPSKVFELSFPDIKAAVIVCNEPSCQRLRTVLADKTYIIVEEPKRIFSKIVNRLFVHSPQPGVHPTACVHEEAVIGKQCYIGPFSYIGKCKIGDHAIIHGHCHIYDNVEVGSHTVIHAGVVLGSDGFGYARDEHGEIEKFPHIGGVIVGDHVEIGANTCVDRGALGNTIIESGVKIDNLVHVAHNVLVHENAFLIANAMIGGSTIIGRGAWIAPSASLLQQLEIGENATIGVGAVVTKNVPAGETWTGSPARPLQEFLAVQKKIKNL